MNNSGDPLVLGALAGGLAGAGGAGGPGAEGEQYFAASAGMLAVSCVGVLWLVWRLRHLFFARGGGGLLKRVGSVGMLSGGDKDKPSSPLRRPRRDSDVEAPHVPLLTPAGAQSMLSETQMAQIRAELPAMHRWSDWRLLFSSAVHGFSLDSFFRLSHQQGPSLLFVLDQQGHLFGAFASEAWRHGTGYFGTGTTFVFTIKPRFRVFKWSRSNDCFLVGRSDFVAVGGGDEGGFALMLDACLERGSSSPCQTFASPCLASSSSFVPVRVELWGFP